MLSSASQATLPCGEAATWHVSVCFPCPPGTTHARLPAATPKLHATGSGPRLLLRSAQTIPRPTSPPCTRHHPGHSTSNKPPSTTTCMHRTPPIGRPVTEPPPTDITRDALLHHPHKIPSTKAPGCPAGSCVLGSARLASLARSLEPPSPFFWALHQDCPDRGSNTALLAFQSDYLTHYTTKIARDVTENTKLIQIPCCTKACAREPCYIS